MSARHIFSIKYWNTVITNKQMSTGVSVGRTLTVLQTNKANVWNA